MSTHVRGLCPIYLVGLIICSHYVSSLQTPMRWCGKPLNVVDSMKSSMFSTAVMASCKEGIKAVNVKPSIIKELKRFCVVIRMCYSLAEDYKQNITKFRRFILDCGRKFSDVGYTAYPGLLESYNYNVSVIHEGLKLCAQHLLPLEEKYVLGMAGWFNYFVSG